MSLKSPDIAYQKILTLNNHNKLQGKTFTLKENPIRYFVLTKLQTIFDQVQTHVYQDTSNNFD